MDEHVCDEVQVIIYHTILYMIFLLCEAVSTDPSIISEVLQLPFMQQLYSYMLLKQGGVPNLGGFYVVKFDCTRVRSTSLKLVYLDDNKNTCVDYAKANSWLETTMTEDDMAKHKSRIYAWIKNIERRVQTKYGKRFLVGISLFCFVSEQKLENVLSDKTVYSIMYALPGTSQAVVVYCNNENTKYTKYMKREFKRKPHMCE